MITSPLALFQERDKIFLRFTKIYKLNNYYYNPVPDREKVFGRTFYTFSDFCWVYKQCKIVKKKIVEI